MYLYKKYDTVLEPYREGYVIDDLSKSHEIFRLLIGSYVSNQVVNKCRHYAVCKICGQNTICFYEDSEGKKVPVTSCDIKICKPCGNGSFFVNSSIIHYVLFHQYKPEEELIDALQSL